MNSRAAHEAEAERLGLGFRLGDLSYIMETAWKFPTVNGKGVMGVKGVMGSLEPSASDGLR